MIRTAILGCGGRMGKLLVQHVVADPGLVLHGATEIAGSPCIGRDAGVPAGLPEQGVTVTADPVEALTGADAVIDFTSPDNTCACAPVAAAEGLAMIIGTTGMSDARKTLLADLASDGARIVFAPNMSVGINLLFHLCSRVVPLLGHEYDIEVVEMHHNRKKDAPSGTAVRLGEILAEAAGMDYAADAVHGRVGAVGARTKREIGMHAIRGGDVVGDHTIVFAADGERVELAHKASSRETFVRGALRAVHFLVDAAPGLYDMQDVLGLA